MIVSMTGYGCAERADDAKRLAVEVRSVNHRYYDVNVRAPRLFLYLEDTVRQLVRQVVARGKVDVYVTLEFLAGENVEVSLNVPIFEGYLSALREMARLGGLEDKPAAAALARLPDVFSMRREKVDARALTEEVADVTREALASFSKMRRAEGREMALDILERLGVIRTLVAQVEARSLVTEAEYRAKLTARMKEALAGVAVDENRILAEAALYADKVSVSEETVRLRSHAEQLEALVQEGGAVGRKLDFLVQEMNREANTIGSKGGDAAITRLVVELKSEIEKIREQVQNVE